MVNLERFKQVRAIIADWDDTKVNTRPKIVEIVDNFADILEVERPGETGLLEFWGQSVEEIIHGLFGRHRPHLSSQEILQQYISSVPPDYCPYPINGVEQAVLRLQTMGFVQGIVSSGSRDDILRAIQTHYPALVGVYTFIHGRQNTPKRKPHPEVFDPAFNDFLYPLGITEEQTVYVGDFHGDFDAAEARGLLFLPIVDNYKAREWFTKRGVDESLMFPSFTHIPEFFANLRTSAIQKESKPSR